MAVLYGKKRGSAYNWKDDALWLLKLVEDFAIVKDGVTVLEGEIDENDKAQINRIRRIAGWEEPT